MVRFSLLDTSSRAGGVSLSLPFRTPVGFLFVERRKGDVDRVALVAKVSSSHVAPSLEKMIRRRAFFEPAALREIPPFRLWRGLFQRGLPLPLRIPKLTGRAFRFEAGRHSGMKPATIPINIRPL